MKKILRITLLISGLAGLVQLQALAQQDTTIVAEKKVIKKFNMNFSVNGDKRDTTRIEKSSKGHIVTGITFTRFDLGFSRLVDNGSFSLSPQNDFLDYRDAKTSTVSFDLLHFGYRFNTNFKIYVAAGFDWTLIRLKKNITIQENNDALTYINEPIDFDKNRFSSSYVHFPLNFELRTKENRNGKRLYLIFGPELGILLNGKVKQISDERGKEKNRDDFNFQSLRYGGTVRVGYGWIGLFTKYYFNDMFETPAQKGLKNMSFGISFGLN